MKQLALRKQLLRPTLWLLGYTVVVGSLLLWQLGTLAPAGTLEVTQCTTAQNGSPANLIASLFAFSDRYNCSPGHAAWMRLPAVLAALMAGGLFIWALRLWIGRQAAIYGGVLFVSAAWFLHAGRFSVATSLPLLLIPIVLWLRQAAPRYAPAAWFGYVAAIAVSLLVSLPGGIWFALLLLALYNQQILDYLQRQKPLTVALQFVIFLTALVPLLYYMIVSDVPYAWLQWLGVNYEAARNPLQGLATSINNLGVLFWRGPDVAQLWLGGLPVLDVVATITSLVGLGWFLFKKRGKTAMLVAGLLMLTILLAGFSPLPASGLSTIVPLFYFLAATGLWILIQRWRSVFPLNPFARSLAYVLVTLVVTSSVTYNVRAYFVAWPHNQAVIDSFRRGL